jgi:membrane protein implicated in regulation of membrane protease activity
MTASTTLERTTRPHGTVGTIATGGAIGLVLALVGAAVVFLIGNAGAPTRVVTGWAPDGADLTMIDVTVTTVSSVVAGALLLWVLERFAARGFAIWVAIAAVVTVVSFLPLWQLEVDTASKVTLSVMHVVVGIAAIAGQDVARRRR